MSAAVDVRAVMLHAFDRLLTCDTAAARGLGLTKRQAINECRKIANELIRRMERNASMPHVRTWAMDGGSNRSLAHEAFALSIVHNGSAN